MGTFYNQISAAAVVLALTGCSDRSVQSGSEKPVATTKSVVTNEAPPVIKGEFDWTQEVEAEDYGEFIANLRRIKCPEDTIRDIVVKDLDENYVARLRRQLETAGIAEKYWTFASSADKAQSRPYGIRKALEAEKKQTLMSLLGLNEEEAEAPSKIRVGQNMRKLETALPAYVTAENAEDFRRLDSQMDQTHKQLQLRAKETNMTRAELRRHQRATDTQFERQLARTMGQDEVRTHMLRKSYLADELRNRLIGFKPTEEEFADIYSIMRGNPDYDLSAGAVSGSTESESAKSLQAELRLVLGDERFGVLQSKMSPVLRMQERLRKNRGLDAETARQAAELTAAHWAAMDDLREQTELDGTERQRRADQMKAEHEANLAAIGAANQRQLKRAAKQKAKN